MKDPKLPIYNGASAAQPKDQFLEYLKNDNEPAEKKSVATDPLPDNDLLNDRFYLKRSLQRAASRLKRIHL